MQAQKSNQYFYKQKDYNILICKITDMIEQQLAHEFYEWISSQQHPSANFMKFNEGEQVWRKYNTASNLKTYSAYELYTKQNQQGSLKLLSLNVLTDCTMEAPLKRNILYSQERYAFILHQISSIFPHVITFNEVTHHFYSQLAACDWVRKHYWLTQFQHKQSDGSFNVIACRLPPLYLTSIKADNCSRHILTAFFIINNNNNIVSNNKNNNNNGNKIISISCAHLTSNIKNIERRRKQIKQLSRQLPSMFTSRRNEKIEIMNIVQGDLNIHVESQNSIFKQMGWADAWIERYAALMQHNNNNNENNKQLDKQQFNKQLEQYSKHCERVLQVHPGYTFDSEVNSLIKQVFWGLQARRMRLDRVIYKGNLHCTDIRVVLDKPIYNKNAQQYPRMGYGKAVVSLLGDIAGFNIFRNKQEYLFPSDHFGLLSKFQFAQ